MTFYVPEMPHHDDTDTEPDDIPDDDVSMDSSMVSDATEPGHVDEIPPFEEGEYNDSHCEVVAGKILVDNFNIQLFKNLYMILVTVT